MIFGFLLNEQRGNRAVQEFQRRVDLTRTPEERRQTEQWLADWYRTCQEAFAQAREQSERDARKRP